MTPEQFDKQLDVFYASATPNRAIVCAQLRQPLGDNLRLSGQVRGPHCLYSTTLPATIRLQDARPGETLLAKALAPDPCYWTPDLPFLYEVQVELSRGDEVLATGQRMLGMRNLSARGKFFYLGGKRWTLRGAFRESLTSTLLATHDAPLALFCAQPPDDAFCEEAARVGVLLVVRLDGVVHDLPAELRRLSRHAAVAIVALDTESPIDAQMARHAPNVLLAAYFDTQNARHNSSHIAAWISAAEQDDFARLAAEADRPVIAVRAESHEHATSAREGCDRLQADLAALGDFAGYIV